MTHLEDVYGAKLKLKPADLDLHETIVERIFPTHPGVISAHGPKIIRITDREPGVHQGLKYASFTLAFPVSKRIKDIEKEKLITKSFERSYVGSNVIVFTDLRYMFFVKKYAVPEKMLLYILDALNPGLFFSGFMITAKIDHNSEAFTKRLLELDTVRSLKFVVRTVDNPDLGGIRKDLDELQEELLAEEYSIEFYNRYQWRSRDKSLNIRKDSVDEFLRDVIESKQMDIVARGKKKGGKLHYLKTSDHYKKEQMPWSDTENKTKFLENCIKLISKWKIKKG